MSKIFLDTCFLISLFRKEDSNHKQAKLNKNILSNHECYISNGILLELITVLTMKTKNIEKTNSAYYFIQDNIKILNEYEIPNYNDKVFSIFNKYNNNSFKLGFIDCSSAIITNYYDLDFVVTFDKKFKLLEEIQLYNLIEK